MNKLEPWEDSPLKLSYSLKGNEHFSPSIGVPTAQQRLAWERQLGKPATEAGVVKFYTSFRGRRYDQFGVRYGSGLSGNIE